MPVIATGSGESATVIARSADCALAAVAVTRVTRSTPIAVTPPRSARVRRGARRFRGSALPAPTPTRLRDSGHGDRRQDASSKRPGPPAGLESPHEGTALHMLPPLDPLPGASRDRSAGGPLQRQLPSLLYL